MKNGTSQAVLVRDLLSGDGPYAPIADDFLSGMCTLCSQPVEHEYPFIAGGYVCEPCADLSR